MEYEHNKNIRIIENKLHKKRRIETLEAISIRKKTLDKRLNLRRHYVEKHNNEVLNW